MTAVFDPDPPLPDSARERLELLSDAELARRLDRIAAAPEDMRSRAMREALAYGWELQRDRALPVTAFVREAEALIPRLSPAMLNAIRNTWPVEGVVDGLYLPHQHLHIGWHRGTQRALQRRGLLERRWLPAGKNHAYRLTPLGRAVRVVLNRDHT